MAHIASIEDEEQETILDEDEIETTRHRRGKAFMTADEYIENVVGTPESDDVTESDVEITDVKPTNAQKRKWDSTTGTKVTWSSEEEFMMKDLTKERAAKRAKSAESKKKLAAKTKKLFANRKKAKKEGKPLKERVWGQDSDDSDVDENIPDYIVKRRKEFDEGYRKLNDAGLRGPPSYEDVEFSDNDRLEFLEERPQFPPSTAPSQTYTDIGLPFNGFIPASIAQYLRDYQIKGVEFLYDLFVLQKGGILGDDMGLGKTVQVAAFLTAAFGKTGDERDAKRMRKMRRLEPEPWYPRVLIICPSSLMQNWKNELERWGWWHVEQYHGKTRDETLKAITSGRAEVVVTTYTTYTQRKDDLNRIAWDCVVADECHTIKENSTQVTKAMNEINALCRIGLTGTAIQNNYEELWTLLNWTNPGRLGPMRVWKDSISEPLRVGQSHDATFKQLKQARITAKKLVTNLLPGFFLRRMKSLIAHQLPKKTDRVVFCQLTDTQREAYERFLDSDYVQTIRCAPEPCGCGSKKTQGGCCNKFLPGTGTKWTAGVFPVMTTLQKLSNHLALLIPRSHDVQEKQSKDLEYLQMMVPDRWRELYEHRDSLASMVNSDYCGKWNVLKKLLKHWYENGDKVLIFSHSVKLLRMLEVLFKNTSYNVSFLSGSMPPEERQTTVDDFNSDPKQFVFLISTKAGGVGLNITSANKVVIFDPNWNPSYDLQAQDRAYRIGQQRDVEVFRLISAGTIEEIVYARQIYKQQQANIGYTASTERRYFKGVQNRPDQRGEIFGLENLFTFHADDVVLRDIVNKTNVAEAKRGVAILEVDFEDILNDDENPLKTDDDDENGAMSQLAALVTKGEPVKRKMARSDPIQAILASAGVEYTHENSEVVGSSRVEAQLSRRAEETGDITEVGLEKLFGGSQGAAGPGTVQYEYHPPEDVMMRQLCTMAKTFGFGSATEFAFVVEGWTQEQRRDCLERFYSKRRELIAEGQKTENMQSEIATGGGPLGGAVNTDDDDDEL